MYFVNVTKRIVDSDETSYCFSSSILTSDLYLLIVTLICLIVKQYSVDKMDKLEAGFYDVCLILAERIRQIEEAMENKEKQKQILLKTLEERGNLNNTKNTYY